MCCKTDASTNNLGGGGVFRRLHLPSVKIKIEKKKEREKKKKEIVDAGNNVHIFGIFLPWTSVERTEETFTVYGFFFFFFYLSIK